MEKREELLWRKLKVEITPNHQNMRLRRASTDGVTGYEVPTFNNPNDESSQIASPTFRKHFSIKSQAGQEGQESFSFGQQMLYDIQHMLKLPSQENNFEKNYLSPSCLQCETLSTSRQQRTVSRAIVEQIVQKISNFVVEVKYIIESLKLGLNSYKESFESQKQFWENSLNFILANLQIKKQNQKKELQQKIQKMEQQNYFSGEKYKILQKKSHSLQIQVSELINAVNSQRMNNETLNKKLFQVNEQLHAKIAQNTKLLETTCSLKLKLGYDKQNNLNENLEKNSNKMENKQKINKFGLQLNQLGGVRNKFSKSQYDTSTPNQLFQVPSPTGEGFPEFTESLTFSHVKNEQKTVTSPLLKLGSNYSSGNTKILQQKQKNCNRLNELLTQPKIQSNKKVGFTFDNSCKTSRKNSAHSIISQFAERRGSLNMNIEKVHDDKNRLLDKIKKLKQDISTQIQDLGSMKRDKY